MKENKINFDRVINRRNTSCARWDTMDAKYGEKDLIHLGVADMDFRSPQAIIDAFSQIIENGVFGYTDLTDSFYLAIQRWLKKQHEVEVAREDIVFCPRINMSSALAIESLTEVGDEVIINTPAYGPLHNAITKNGRQAINSPLIFENEKYQINFKEMEELISPKTKMFILCSPHNPVGRVWSKEELERIGEFCLKHDLFLFVDEIHSDILAKGVVFTSVLKLSKEIRERIILANSLTKTFNVPGVIVSYLIVENKEIRQKICLEIDRLGIHNPTIFALAAVVAGYTKCDDWYKEMLKYIDANDAFTRKYFKKYFPEIRILNREATYLLWMDCQGIGASDKDLEKWFIKEARVAVYMGNTFGKEGEGYIRVNIASPRKTLEEAFERMRKVYHKLIKND